VQEDDGDFAGGGGGGCGRTPPALPLWAMAAGI
jgi:hypothetical protein